MAEFLSIERLGISAEKSFRPVTSIEGERDMVSIRHSKPPVQLHITLQSCRHTGMVLKGIMEIPVVQKPAHDSNRELMYE